MITIIPNLPEHVLGVRASGEVTKDDLEGVLIPAMDALVACTGGIHYLLVLDTDVKNWDSGAWMSDAKLGLKYLTKWHKIAVVSEETAVKQITNLLSPVFPGETRGYNHAQMQDAFDWVSEHDSRDAAAAQPAA